MTCLAELLAIRPGEGRLASLTIGLMLITAPRPVLMGEYERIFKPAAAVERARRLIPGLVSAEIVPKAGHLVTADQPAWLQQRVFRFSTRGGSCR